MKEGIDCSNCEHRMLYMEHTTDFARRRSIADKKAAAIQIDSKALAATIVEMCNTLESKNPALANESCDGLDIANELHSSVSRLTAEREAELNQRIEVLASCALFCSLEDTCQLKPLNDTYRFKDSPPPTSV